MLSSFAAILFRPREVSDTALSQGFAVALAGFDLPAARLSVSPLRDVGDWSVAFYESGMVLPRGAEDDEFDHFVELFEEELSPPVAVIDAATAEGSPNATLYALVVSGDRIHDDGWRFTPRGYERHFVREGDDGIEAGVEGSDVAPEAPVLLEVPDDESDDEDDEAIEEAIQVHRGSTFASTELRTPVLSALMGALFATDEGSRRVEIRLVPRGPAAITSEVTKLNRVLRRSDGRGAFSPPQRVWDVPLPDTYERFAQTYDFADPTDPADLYRELSIGAVLGTLHFLRERELHALAETRLRHALAKGYPIAELRGSALGAAGGAVATLVLAEDGDRLLVMRQDQSVVPAGPLFGELVRYLALGWSKRSDADEDMIGALMLRARVRVEQAPSARE